MTHWLAPAATVAVAAVVALAFDAWDRRRGAAVAAMLGCAAAAKVAVLGAPAVSGLVDSSSPVGPALSGIAVLVASLGALALLGGWDTLTRDERGGQLSALVALLTSASLLAVSARDVVVLFIALEAMSLCSYALVALGGTDRARESAMKYFVQGSVATGFLLISVALLFVGTGADPVYGSVAGAVAGAGLLPAGAATLAWVLLVSALVFKAGGFPFHSWVPDAYETAASPAAGALATVPKVAAVAVLAVLVAGRASVMVAGEGGSAAASAWLLAALAAGSVVFGNLTALKQTSLRRMLAYSGIAQIGYALTGLVSGAAEPALLLVALYAPAALGAFLVAEALTVADPAWDGTIAGLAGLGRRRPALGAALVVMMLSLTGVPLFAGFWGKFVVFLDVARGPWLWLAIVGVLGSVVSFGYYGAVLRSAYMEEERSSEAARPLLAEDAAQDPGTVRDAAVSGGAATVVACALAVAVVALGVAPLVTGVPVLFVLLGM